MRSVLPFDELNRFVTVTLPTHFDANGRIKSKKDEEDIIDELLDLFLLAYAMGNEVTNASLSSDWTPTLDEVMKTVDKEVAGKTWRERVEDYFANGGSVGDIARIAETETHRDANEAAYRTAINGGATMKTWECMMLPTSRDSHIWLNGTTVPIDAYFYADDGSRAQFPGEFGVPEQDCNCLCQLSFS